MNAGVSKSGSPAPKPTTSIPAFFMAAALALTANVIDSQHKLIRSATGNIRNSLHVRRSQRYSISIAGSRRFRVGQRCLTQQIGAAIEVIEMILIEHA